MSYKIQYLGLRGILGQSVTIYKEHFGLLFRIVLMVFAPFSLIDGLIMLAITPVVPSGATVEELQHAHELQLQAIQQYWPVYAISFALAMFLFYPLTYAALIQAVAGFYLGTPVTAAEAVRLGFTRFGPLVWTSILKMLFRCHR